MRALIFGCGLIAGCGHSRFARPSHRGAAAPPDLFVRRRCVIEIERGWDLFGDPANLWLYELP
jgi:hypothetical protein